MDIKGEVLKKAMKLNCELQILQDFARKENIPQWNIEYRMANDIRQGRIIIL